MISWLAIYCGMRRYDPPRLKPGVRSENKDREEHGPLPSEGAAGPVRIPRDSAARREWRRIGPLKRESLAEGRRQALTPLSVHEAIPEASDRLKTQLHRRALTALQPSGLRCLLVAQCGTMSGQPGSPGIVEAAAIDPANGPPILWT